MADEADLKCPRCGGHNLESRELGIRGVFWRVAFGSGFGKEDIVAHACRECRFVFLELVAGTPMARSAGRLFGRCRRS